MVYLTRPLHERPQREELARGEELTPAVEAVAVNGERTARAASTLRRGFLRQPEGDLREHARDSLLRLSRCHDLVLGREPILLPLRPVYDDSGHHRAEPSCLTFEADVLHGHDRAATGAAGARARHGARGDLPIVLPLLGCVSTPGRDVLVYAEHHPVLAGSRLHGKQDPFLFFAGEPLRLQKGQRCPTVLAGHGPSPEVCNGWLRHPARIRDVGKIFLAELGIEIFSVDRSIRCERHQGQRTPLEFLPMLPVHRLEFGVCRVIPRKVTPCVIEHPASPRANVPGEVRLRRPACVFGAPLGEGLFVLSDLTTRLLRRPDQEGVRGVEGIHELLVPEDELRQGMFFPRHPLRVIERALEHEPRNRIYIAGDGFAAQPHGLEGDCSAAGKRVKNTGGSPAICLSYFIPEPLESLFVLFLPAPVEDAAFGLLLLPHHRLAIRHLLAL